MKHDSCLSSLLALGFFIFSMLACSSSATPDNGKSASTPAATPTPASLQISEVQLMRDDGTGKHGETVTNFKYGDAPLHCLVGWDNPEPHRKIKISWMLVDAGGAKNRQLGALEDETKNDSDFNIVTTYTPKTRLLRGQYKIEVYVDDKLQNTTPFMIE